MTKKIIALALMFCLVFEQSGFAQVAPQISVPAYLNGMLGSDRFRPMHLRSLSLDPASDRIDFVLDQGDSRKDKPAEVESISRQLMDYFKIGLVLPNSSFWVNLRPDAADRVIDPLLEKTDLGKVLLEADVQLKKDMAAATSPRTPEGRQYWDRLYAKVDALFSADEDVEIPTFTRPWIVPGEIIIADGKQSAYIYKATLKVCLEQDFLKDSPGADSKDARFKDLNDYSCQLMRELIIPKLTREVNSGKRYAQLRQAYYSLVLAQWFKAKSSTGRVSAVKNDVLSKIDCKDLDGLTSRKKWSKETYFKQYRKSFSEGEYSFDEEVKGKDGISVRNYTSGGADLMIRFADAGPSAAAATPLITVMPYAASGNLAMGAGAIAARFDGNAFTLMPANGIDIAVSSVPSTAEADGGEKAIVRLNVAEARELVKPGMAFVFHAFVAFIGKDAMEARNVRKDLEAALKAVPQDVSSMDLNDPALTDIQKRRLTEAAEFLESLGLNRDGGNSEPAGLRTLRQQLGQTENRNAVYELLTRIENDPQALVQLKDKWAETVTVDSLRQGDLLIIGKHVFLLEGRLGLQVELSLYSGGEVFPAVISDEVSTIPMSRDGGNFENIKMEGLENGIRQAVRTADEDLLLVLSEELRRRQEASIARILRQEGPVRTGVNLENSRAIKTIDGLGVNNSRNGKFDMNIRDGFNEILSAAQVKSGLMGKRLVARIFSTPNHQHVVVFYTAEGLKDRYKDGGNSEEELNVLALLGQKATDVVQGTGSLALNAWNRLQDLKLFSENNAFESYIEAAIDLKSERGRKMLLAVIVSDTDGNIIENAGYVALGYRYRNGKMIKVKGMYNIADVELTKDDYLYFSRSFEGQGNVELYLDPAEFSSFRKMAAGELSGGSTHDGGLESDIPFLREELDRVNDDSHRDVRLTVEEFVSGFNPFDERARERVAIDRMYRVASSIQSRDAGLPSEGKKIYPVISENDLKALVAGDIIFYRDKSQERREYIGIFLNYASEDGTALLRLKFPQMNTEMFEAELITERSALEKFEGLKTYPLFTRETLPPVFLRYRFGDDALHRRNIEMDISIREQNISNAKMMNQVLQERLGKIEPYDLNKRNEVSAQIQVNENNIVIWSVELNSLQKELGLLNNNKDGGEAVANLVELSSMMSKSLTNADDLELSISALDKAGLKAAELSQRENTAAHKALEYSEIGNAALSYRQNHKQELVAQPELDALLIRIAEAGWWLFDQEKVIEARRQKVERLARQESEGSVLEGKSVLDKEVLVSEKKKRDSRQNELETMIEKLSRFGLEAAIGAVFSRKDSRQNIGDLLLILEKSNNVYDDLLAFAEAGKLEEALPFMNTLKDRDKGDTNVFEHTLKFIRYLELIGKGDREGFNEGMQGWKLSEEVFDRYHAAFNDVAADSREKLLLYLIVLLHDTGEAIQTQGHPLISSWIAESYLKHAGFTDAQVAEAGTIIASHVDLGTLFFGERSPDYFISSPQSLNIASLSQQAKLKYLKLLALITLNDVRSFADQFISREKAQFYIDVSEEKFLEGLRYGFDEYRLRLFSSNPEGQLDTEKFAEVEAALQQLSPEERAGIRNMLKDSIEVFDYGIFFLQKLEGKNLVKMFYLIRRLTEGNDIARVNFTAPSNKAGDASQGMSEFLLNDLRIEDLRSKNREELVALLQDKGLKIRYDDAQIFIDNYRFVASTPDAETFEKDGGTVFDGFVSDLEKWVEAELGKDSSLYESNREFKSIKQMVYGLSGYPKNADLDLILQQAGILKNSAQGTINVLRSQGPVENLGPQERNAYVYNKHLLDFADFVSERTSQLINPQLDGGAAAPGAIGSAGARPYAEALEAIFNALTSSQNDIAELSGALKQLRQMAVNGEKISYTLDMHAWISALEMLSLANQEYSSLAKAVLKAIMANSAYGKEARNYAMLALRNDVQKDGGLSEQKRKEQVELITMLLDQSKLWYFGDGDQFHTAVVPVSEKDYIVKTVPPESSNPDYPYAHIYVNTDAQPVEIINALLKNVLLFPSNIRNDDAAGWIEAQGFRAEQRKKLEALKEEFIKNPAVQTRLEDFSAKKDGGEKDAVQPQNFGGIDFRGLPITSSPAANPALMIVPDHLAKADAKAMDDAWKQIQTKIQSGPVPFEEMRGYVAACCQRKECSSQLKAVSGYIRNILKLEEEAAVTTAPELKEILSCIS